MALLKFRGCTSQNACVILLSFLLFSPEAFGVKPRIQNNDNVKKKNAETLYTLYTIEKVHLTGNVRVPSKAILTWAGFREGAELSPEKIKRQMQLAKAKLKSTGLFLFADIHLQYDLTSVEVYINVAENVILLEMLSIEEGSFTRFHSITAKAPDFGFLVGPEKRFLYLRYHRLFSSPADFIAVIRHEAYDIEKKPLPVSHEAAVARFALEISPGGFFQLKVPAGGRYNIQSEPGNTGKTEIWSGLEGRLERIHWRDVYFFGFDLGAGVYAGEGDFHYTKLKTWAHVYAKPPEKFHIEERIRIGYDTLLGGALPDYGKYRIDNAFWFRGEAGEFGLSDRRMVVNVESWVHDIFIIPAAISDIHISFFAFADFAAGGMSGDIAAIFPVDSQTWYFSGGAAVHVLFQAPLNLSMTAGYGNEVWQGGDGLFFVKMGYEFYSGSFYE